MIVNRRTLISTATALCLIFGTASCSTSETVDDTDRAAGPPQSGGTLTVAVLNEITASMNPHETNDPSLAGFIAPVYSKLVDFAATEDGSLGDVVGDLAESWEISDDGLTYTFTLRSGVRWHDVAPLNGRDLVAADVVASFEDLFASTEVVNMFPPVTSVTAPDEVTVVFTLSEPYAPMLQNLAFHYNVVLPPEGIEGEFDLGSQAIGTGPFMFESHTPDSEWVLVKNPDYYEPEKPYLDELRFVIVPDAAAQTAALRSGRVDVGSLRDLATAEQLVDSGSLDMITSPVAPATFYINPAQEPYDDIRVRRAVAMAIDWDGMGKAIRGQYSLSSIVPPTAGAYALTEDEVRELRPYDPEQARQLLTEAGHPDGFATTFLLQRTSEEDIREAQWMQEDLKAIGIDATLEIVDPGTAIDRRRAGNFELHKALRGQVLPDQFLTDFEPGARENYTNIDDPTLQAMIEQSRATSDEAERAEQIREIARYMETEVATVLYGPVIYAFNLYRTEVHDYRTSPIRHGRAWADVWIEQ
ncbi:ABC transporter substrate-binding protein [Solwaraspora sp. WMMB335]|uniref:ABC transporter substrate-binding protein n=1 Tax=Solwaraspora sp. WMMB335 TaxID=3404118 RepID=UPI003B964E01